MFNLNLKFDSVQKHNDTIHENGIYNEILSKHYQIQNAELTQMLSWCLNSKINTPANILTILCRMKYAGVTGFFF